VRNLGLNIVRVLRGVKNPGATDKNSAARAYRRVEKHILRSVFWMGTRRECQSKSIACNSACGCHYAFAILYMYMAMCVPPSRPHSGSDWRHPGVAGDVSGATGEDPPPWIGGWCTNFCELRPTEPDSHTPRPEGSGGTPLLPDDYPTQQQPLHPAQPWAPHQKRATTSRTMWANSFSTVIFIFPNRPLKYVNTWFFRKKNIFYRSNIRFSFNRSLFFRHNLIHLQGNF
jgi:hypothetical protein